VKTRILFVDDESMVLQGLERSLRQMRNEWDMQFVDSGQKALDAMALAPFDVVVSDMRMPGMNGAQLLNAVMEKYPKTVRLILSGHTDHDLILKSVGSTHQFLSKPCDPEELKSTILRASKLGVSLDNEKLKQLVSRIDRLPSLPTLFTEVVKVLEAPDASIAQVSKVVQKDMSMTAQMLKLVNSAFFGLRRQVSNITDAINFLGLDTIKSLVLSIQTFQQFEKNTITAIAPAALWAHSLRVAEFARMIARLENAPRKMVDECFSAGLLHDTGKLLLAMHFPEPFKEAARVAEDKKITMWKAEREVFGTTHAEVGGLLLGLWGLPVPIVEAVTFHHEPARCPSMVFSPLAVVHAADALEHEQTPGGVDAQLDRDFLRDLDLTGKVALWRETFLDISGKGFAE
jgi:HD-like signal output (HDOD) protein